jgi:octaprenyl-diphosphate synthase
VAAADAEQRAFWQRTIEKGDQRDGDLSRALELMHAHGALEATRAEALEWAARARAAIARLPDHPVQRMLDHLAGYVVARIS